MLSRTKAQLNLRAKADRQHHIIIHHKWAIGLSRVLKSGQEANEEIVNVPITTETEVKTTGEITSR